jgi:tRNA 2-thiouridine synthesizing protein C
MTSHFFLLGTHITQERLSWIDESLKFFFVKLFPETLRHHTKPKENVFTFLITRDALYSLHEPETQQVWEKILLLPSVRIICDRQELDLRGISVERLKMKYTDQVIDHNSLSLNGQTSFWRDVVKIARQHEQPIPTTIGYLQLESPYMHQSSLSAVHCLAAAIEVQADIELYAYLDGVHLGHIGQNPTEYDNIGKGLEDIAELASKRDLHYQMLACSRCAAARGYSTWDDGQGIVISTCTIKPFKIRNLNEVIARFDRNHLILGENVASIQLKKKGQPETLVGSDKGHAPPVTILITRSPYGTEHAFGALSFAIACAYNGILTRVIFIEDGVNTVCGTHQLSKDARYFNLQEVIDVVAGSENLQLYVFQPSLQQRGIAKNKKMTAVLDIGVAELGQLFFNPPQGIQANHQRILFF